MPEAATAEEIEKVYLEGWKLGLKAIAVYRDNSKRSQPLSTGKKTGDAGAETIDSEEVEKLRRQLAKAEVEARLPHRRRLPAERSAITHKFDIAGHEGYITVGLYPDGQPGEIFLKMAKEGSTVSGLMDTLATTISVALQYGVPLKDLVNKFAHVRFEPSGFTGNQEIPIAKSIVDYIFRWLGSRFLSPEDRINLGLQERTSDAPIGFGAPSGVSTHSAEPGDAVLPASPAAEPARSPEPDTAPKATAVTAESVSGTSTPAPAEALAVIATNGALAATANGHANGNRHTDKASGGATAPITLNLGATKVSFQTQADAPSCMDCGSIMVRNGSCYKCLNCGSTSGCS
jgi:ribonucleoside-diphosphate reductase alpha chain